MSSVPDTDNEFTFGNKCLNGDFLIGLDGNYPNTALFHHEGETNTLLSSVSINGETPNNLLDALNAWVISQNDPTLRLWTLDSITGYPVFGDYFVPSCYVRYTLQFITVNLSLVHLIS